MLNVKHKYSKAVSFFVFGSVCEIYVLLVSACCTHFMFHFPKTLFCGNPRLIATAVAIALSGIVPALSSGVSFRFCLLLGIASWSLMWSKCVYDRKNDELPCQVLVWVFVFCVCLLACCLCTYFSLHLSLASHKCVFHLYGLQEFQLATLSVASPWIHWMVDLSLVSRIYIFSNLLSYMSSNSGMELLAMCLSTLAVWS